VSALAFFGTSDDKEEFALVAEVLEVAFFVSFRPTPCIESDNAGEVPSLTGTEAARGRPDEAHASLLLAIEQVW
jgi:hypothetical protein